MAVGGIAVVSVPVSDQERAKRFYCDAVDGAVTDAPWGTYATFADVDGNTWVLTATSRPA